MQPSDNISLCIPYVGGIIERTINGKRELLLQTRWKPERIPVYSGTFEFPAGILDRPFENVIDALAREIKEETGLTLKHVKGLSKTKEYSPKGDDLSFGFRPFCCTQQLRNGKPWIGFVFVCEVEEGEPISQQEEVKDIRWVEASII